MPFDSGRCVLLTTLVVMLKCLDALGNTTVATGNGFVVIRSDVSMMVSQNNFATQDSVESEDWPSHDQLEKWGALTLQE